MRKSVMTVCLLVVGLTGSAMSAQSFDSVSLAEWRSFSQGTRIETFSKFSPGKRAAMMSGHLLAWAAEHREELSADQLQLITDVSKLIVPEAYDGSMSTSAKKAFEAQTVQRAQALLRPEQIAELFYLQGDPIPLKK